MTTTQKRIILEKVVLLERDIEELKRARIDVAKLGYASATLSSSGGSKSYTRLDIDKISNLIWELQKELAQYMNMLSGGNGTSIKTIATVYSWGI